MTTASSTQVQFGKWRSFLWPIHNWELKKFIPMALLFFFINFNYTLLRDTKDVLIVTAKGSGAEAIPFLKLWGVLPFAILFMIVYAKLSNILSKPKLFYTLISFFIGFFALFSLVLYPNREFLHPHAFADRLQAMLPQGFSGLIAIFRNWVFALFYIMAELWGSAAMSLAFWGFANDITRASETKRFYGVLGIGANVAMLFSGKIIKYFSQVRLNSVASADATNSVLAGYDPWTVTLNYLMSFVVISAIIVMVIYWWINKNVLTDSRFYDPSEQQKVKKDKPKMTLKESFIYLAKSRYIRLLGLLVVCYGIAINLIEVTWKNQLKTLFADPNQYSAFMGDFSFYTGAATIFMMLFVSGNITRRFGWTTAAMITPVVLLVTGVGFFSFILFKDNLTGLIGLLGTSPLVIAVIIGQIQNIMSKASKYSLFDPTKEGAYVPLDQESKVKGKAAIDVGLARAGKSGGAVINQGLILAFGSISLITPYVAAILFIIIFVWMWSVKSLGKLYNEKVAQTHDRIQA